MGDKNQNQSQIEKLIELANQLEKREQALAQESRQLEQQRAALEEKERSLAAGVQNASSNFRQSAAAAAPFMAAGTQPVPMPQAAPPVPQAATPQAAPAPPPIPQPAPPPAAPPAKAPAPMSAEVVSELSDVLKNIFWDYSNSVHQISSQLSTVTAAMMCAAVTGVLENRGFDAKEVFIREMEKMIAAGGLGHAYQIPATPARPAPVHRQAPAAVPVSYKESAPVTAPAPAPAPVSRPVPVPPPVQTGILDADDDDDEVRHQTPLAAAAVPQRMANGVLRIATAADFHKLGEYGYRNDEKIRTVELPEGVTQLPGSFFYGCANLEEIWLPASLQEIGAYAFYGCEKLRAVHLAEPSALRDIGEYAFAMCGSLESFQVPAAVEALGTSVFRFCSGMKSISFTKDSALRQIGSHLLQNCTALTKVRLPDSITVIPTSMFYGCSNLEKVVAKGVETIEDYAFYGNESLRTVRIRTKGRIAMQAFEGCNPAMEIEYLNY